MPKKPGWTWETDRKCWKTYRNGTRYRAPKGYTKEQAKRWWTKKVRELEVNALEKQSDHRNTVLKFREDYAECISQWRILDSFARENGNEFLENLAHARLTELNKRLDSVRFAAPRENHSSVDFDGDASENTVVDDNPLNYLEGNEESFPTAEVMRPLKDGASVAQKDLGDQDNGPLAQQFTIVRTSDPGDWLPELDETDIYPAFRNVEELERQDYRGCEWFYDVIIDQGDAAFIASARREDSRWRRMLLPLLKRCNSQINGETQFISSSEMGSSGFSEIRLAINRFLADRQKDAASGQLSQERCDLLGRHLKIVESFVEIRRIRTPQEVNSEFLSGLQCWLLDSEQGYARSYARDIMGTFKQCLRWLHAVAEEIDTLPRNIAHQSTSIRVPAKEQLPPTLDEIEKCLRLSSGRTRLYILLALNCGMTQQDMSDLRHGEVDWESGLITRQRSKAKAAAYKNAPVIRRKLWPETRALLKEFRNTQSETVLTTINGYTLIHRRKCKTDSVAQAFNKVAKKAKVKTTIGQVKKLSSTLLVGDSRWNGIEDEFLGHSASSIAKRHYSAAPNALLAEATDWLYEQLNIELICRPA